MYRGRHGCSCFVLRFSGLEFIMKDPQILGQSRGSQLMDAQGSVAFRIFARCGSLREASYR
jgi:hypothetical protein